MYLYYPTSQITAYPPPPSCDSASSIRRLSAVFLNEQPREGLSVWFGCNVRACVAGGMENEFSVEAKLALGKIKE